jgi:hypothetical protein
MSTYAEQPFTEFEEVSEQTTVEPQALPSCGGAAAAAAAAADIIPQRELD